MQSTNEMPSDESISLKVFCKSKREEERLFLAFNGCRRFKK
jgi:hypothetical protein